MTLTDQLSRLAAFEPSPYPVVSLYLNTQPNERGRDNFQAFVRKELKALRRRCDGKLRIVRRARSKSIGPA